MALPNSIGKLPRYQLSYDHPSPIHHLPRLTKLVNGSSEKASNGSFWVKRDDQAGPLADYGNKYRKFEYIIPDILSYKDANGQSATTLVTEGGVQSNHTVQVAGMARVLGLKCVVILHKGIGGLRAAKDKDVFLRVGNVHANKLLGANIRWTDERDTGDHSGPLIPVLDELRAEGHVPYWISSGASLHPLGGLGYARCAFEIAEQEKQLLAAGALGGSGRFDNIFVACGSGSTVAGLIAGFKLLEKQDKTSSPRNVIGVLVSRKSRSSQEERILSIAKTAGVLIGLEADIDITPADVVLDDRFVGEAYGILDADTQATLDLLAREEALMLDPVYTGKSMRGMLNWSASESTHMPHADRVSFHGDATNSLFIHTGGQNALSAYADDI